MAIDRAWAIIISGVLLSVLMGKILWEQRRSVRFEAVVSFDGYDNHAKPKVTRIVAEWPDERYARFTVKKLLRSEIGRGSGSMAIGFPDRPLQTTRKRPLVEGQTYSIQLRERIFSRSTNYRLKVFEVLAEGKQSGG